MNPVGKPDAGKRHVRFDERGEETERCRMAQATAPLLDSTRSCGLLNLQYRQFFSRYPVRKIHHTRAMQMARNPSVMPRLRATLTSAIS